MAEGPEVGDSTSAGTAPPDRAAGPATPVATVLDPRRSYFIAIVGRKGSGKSVLASRFWATYPGDRLVLDITGDAELGDDPTIERITDPLPVRWPTRADDARSSLRYVPDPGSPTYRDDLDRAVGLAFNRRGSLCWIDEVGELCPGPNQSGPWMSRALHQGRHRNLSLVMAGPRPLSIDPLVLAQADLVYVFATPNPRDRRRIAEVIGYDPRAFDTAVHALGPHEYLRWDGAELVHFPPLPLRRRRPRSTPAGDVALTG